SESKVSYFLRSSAQMAGIETSKPADKYTARSLAAVGTMTSIVPVSRAATLGARGAALSLPLSLPLPMPMPLPLVLVLATVWETLGGDLVIALREHVRIDERMIDAQRRDLLGDSGAATTAKVGFCKAF